MSGNSTVNNSSSAYDEYQDKVSALHVGHQQGRLFDENQDRNQSNAPPLLLQLIPSALWRERQEN
eukprot:678175-Ditylum_brightwellii.AAC.1